MAQAGFDGQAHYARPIAWLLADRANAFLVGYRLAWVSSHARAMIGITDPPGQAFLHRGVKLPTAFVRSNVGDKPPTLIVLNCRAQVESRSISQSAYKAIICHLSLPCWSLGVGQRSLWLLTKPDSEVGADQHGDPCPGVYEATSGLATLSRLTGSEGAFPPPSLTPNMGLGSACVKRIDCIPTLEPYAVSAWLNRISMSRIMLIRFQHAAPSG